MTRTPSPETPVSNDIKHALDDARNTLAKTATGCIGSDDLTLPRSAFDSALRNIDKARSAMTAPTPSADVSSLIDVVARAICVALGDDPDREGDDRVTAYDDAARAAIAATYTEAAIVLKRYREALEQISGLNSHDYDSDRAWALAMQLRASTALKGWLPDAPLSKQELE
jgi:hypothetical protein